MVGQHVDDVGHRNLKDNVHTAFEVETQTNLCLHALLIRVDAKVFDRVLVVLCLDGIYLLQFCYLSVVVVCGYRERQVEEACKRQQDGNTNY